MSLKIFLNNLIQEFVSLCNKIKQRDKEWYALMGKTVGGSEIAAILGKNKYSTIKDVVNSKISMLDGIDPWKGGDACWWGIMFEDVIARYVEMDLGSKIYGDTICIQSFKGHRYSPDGYMVVEHFRNEEGLLELHDTSMDVPEEKRIPSVVLLEFKCPVSRRPTTAVPEQYVPQILSGLSVSSIASSGLFVDAVFRRCSISDLGHNYKYDHMYHKYDFKVKFNKPLAWGFVAVYSPVINNRGSMAKQMYREYFGYEFDEDVENDEIIDFGDSSVELFKQTLNMIDKKKYSTRVVDPCFADGRGTPLFSGCDYNKVIEDMKKKAPYPSHKMIGVIPWKLFEIYYIPVERDNDFMKEIIPYIQKVHFVVEEVRKSSNREETMDKLLGAKKQRRSIKNKDLESFDPDNDIVSFGNVEMANLMGISLRSK